MINIEKSRIEFFRELFEKMPYGKGVEVGTFKGEFSREIVSKWNGNLYMVDVWRPLGQEYIDASNHINFGSGLYHDAINNIKGFEDRAIMIRATSAIASDIFADESLDFVYIDANHAYEFVKEDIDKWWPKVKKDGWICGHDFLKIDWWADESFHENKIDKHIWSGTHYHGLFGVNPAVEEFCKETGNIVYITNEFFGSWFVRKK